MDIRQADTPPGPVTEEAIRLGSTAATNPNEVLVTLVELAPQSLALGDGIPATLVALHLERDGWVVQVRWPRPLRIVAPLLPPPDRLAALYAGVSRRHPAPAYDGSQ